MKGWELNSDFRMFRNIDFYFDKALSPQDNQEGKCDIFSYVPLNLKMPKRYLIGITSLTFRISTGLSTLFYNPTPVL